MTDGMDAWGGLFGAVIGVGLTLLAIDIIFNKRTGKYYHRQTGEEIPKEKAEQVLGGQRERSGQRLKNVF